MAFFNQIGTEEPRAVEQQMERIGEKWRTKFVSSAKDVSVLFIFYDSLGTVDNNEEYGYWKQFYKNGETIPGSLATIAHMYCGAWNASTYRIAGIRDLAKTLYERDFARLPELKRTYYRHYISSIRYEKEPELFKRELSEYANRSDLTEWELLDISWKYAAIHDSSASKRFEKEIFIKYPTGCWSAQISSNEYQKKFHASDNLSEKRMVYEEFRKKFSGWPGDCARRYLEGVEVIFLRRLIVEYAETNNLVEWRKGADALPPLARYLAYYLSAQSLNERSTALGESERLSGEASKWMEENLNAPRLVTDRLFSSDREVLDSREDRLSECLDVYGVSLMLQSKFDEARNAFERALRYTRTKRDRIERHYAEALNRSTSQGTNEKTSLGKPGIKKPTIKLINEPLRDLSLLDMNGDSTGISKHKGKVIVLDFWASWCGPCLAGFEFMKETMKLTERNHDVTFLLVNTQERGTFESSRRKSMEIMKKGNFNFKVLFDVDSKSGDRFKFSSLPTKVIIDRMGRVRFRQSGLGRESDLTDALNLILREQ